MYLNFIAFRSFRAFQVGGTFAGPRLHYLRELGRKYSEKPAKSGDHSWETSQVGETLVGPRLHYLREPREKYSGRPAKSGPHSWETSQVGGALVGPRLHYLREPRGKCSGPDLMLVHKQSLFYLDGTASQLKQRQCRPSQREMLLHLLLLWLFVDCAFQM